MTTVTSNKLVINVENVVYPIKEVKLYVSTDGKSWDTSVTGNAIYFKAECYDSDGNLADTTLEGVSNCGIVTGQQYSSKMIIGTQTSNDTISTSGGIAEWVNNAPSTACAANSFGEGGCNIYALPYPHPANQSQINDNINNPIQSNNVSVSYMPLQWLTPAKLYITVSPTPKAVNEYCAGNQGLQPYTFYYYNVGTTYTWIFQVLDKNNNPVPMCAVQGLLIMYLYNALNSGKSTIDYQMLTDQNGQFTIKWTPTQTGEIKDIAPYLQIPSEYGYMTPPVYYMGMEIQCPNCTYTMSSMNSYVGTPNPSLSYNYYSGITASPNDNGMQIIIKGQQNETGNIYAYDPNTGKVSTTLNYNAAVPNELGYYTIENVTQDLTGTILSNDAGALDYSIAIINLKGLLNSTIYLVIGPGCVTLNYNSLPIIIATGPAFENAYGGYNWYGSVSVCYNGLDSNGMCKI